VRAAAARPRDLRSGTTSVASCDDGFADVDRDASNCGAVGQGVGQAPHGVLTCSAGQPKLLCADGFADVDGAASTGCETDLNRDPENCGRVGRGVPPVGKLWHVVADACVDGVPTVTRCERGWRDDDGSYLTGCEIPAAPAAGDRGAPAIVVTVPEPETP
jgi:hypothetical protein